MAAVVVLIPNIDTAAGAVVIATTELTPAVAGAAMNAVTATPMAPIAIA